MTVAATMPMPQLTRAVGARLASEYSDIGAEVFWGRERFDRVATRTSVRVTHDKSAQDSWEDGSATRDQQSNAWDKFTSLEVLVIGQSTQPGATEEHHEAVVEAAVDGFMVCLLQVCQGRGYMIRGVTGAYQAPDDDQPAQIGARYLMRMQVGRGVREPQLSTGTSAPTVTGKANVGGVVQEATITG